MKKKLSGRDTIGTMMIEVAIRRGRLTFGIFSELVVKCLNNSYKISKEAQEVLIKEKLVDHNGNILKGVYNPVMEMSNEIIFDIPGE